MEIQAISLDGALPIAQLTSVEMGSEKEQINFSNLLSSSLNNLNTSIVDSNQTIENLALGKTESTHEIVIAMENAKMSLQMAVEVRNKLVEAYQQITRMQI